ncbi:hypothetical protein [Asaia spathodeae]|uniref:Uncharacterized protein n=1 Tax=Asaia spathodeae TaxID=657016 RepID=A0ABX2P7P1_9PROT|nr:hypothetical protein [Asaia spathodeae]GBR20952.1 hypothetical protein AA105894_2677 [Asaia spathodeae NBRC 105894]
MSNWLDKIRTEAELRKDPMEQFVCSLSDADMANDYFEDHTGELIGAESLKKFLAWTKERVYFVVEYDGDYSVGSVPRNPCDEEADSFGG